MSYNICIWTCIIHTCCARIHTNARTHVRQRIYMYYTHALPIVHTYIHTIHDSHMFRSLGRVARSLHSISGSLLRMDKTSKNELSTLEKAKKAAACHVVSSYVKVTDLFERNCMIV